MYTQIDSNIRTTKILIAIFIALILSVAYAIGLYLGQDPTLLVLVAAGISILMSLASYYGGDAVALATSRAKEINKSDNPYLYNMVENLSITAGIPIPKVHIIDDPAINAFATGRNPEHASIAVTRGALERLENEELEGVIAHELSHIKNYDILVMTVVIILVGLVSLIADLSLRGRWESDDDKAGAAVLIIALVFIVLSPIFAELIKLAVSRRREYLADASGALLTRYPEGLARALEKIRDYNQPMKTANHATAHLFLDSPFRTAGKKMNRFFATHPPIDERITALRNM